MEKSVELLILRHGQTEWNRIGRMQGWRDSSLTALGRAQAARQGDILRGLGVGGWPWFSSPQGRAMTTARIALGDAAGPITPDGRLREIGLGDWTGALRETIRAGAPHLFANGDLGWYDHAPGGEGLTALAARAQAFLDDLDGPVVVVTHGITSRVMRALALGMAVRDFDKLPGGQGVVHHIRDGRARVIG